MCVVLQDSCCNFVLLSMCYMKLSRCIFLFAYFKVSIIIYLFIFFGALLLHVSYMQNEFCQYATYLCSHTNHYFCPRATC